MEPNSRHRIADRYYGLSALVLLLAAGVLWMSGLDLASRHYNLLNYRMSYILWSAYRPQLVSVLVGAGAVLVGWYLAWMRQAQEREHARVQQCLHAQLLEAHQGTLQALAAALDLRDTETWGHSRRVQGYSLAMGRVLQLTETEMSGLAAGALLHDVGKIGIPDAILLKPGALTADERIQMNQHVEIGYQLVSKIPYFFNALDVVHYHHERYDGKGYPSGLAGTGIPLSARIFAVADAFDAMVSVRPYRMVPLTHDQARAELRRQAGTQFCPTAVEAFLSLSDGELQQIQAESLRPEVNPLVFAEGPSAHGLDLLTGTLTRNHWEQFRIHMARTRGPALGGVVFVDVDGLKETNDRFGHQVGDLLLTEVGRSLTQTVEAGGVVYRYGGDEFLIWCPPGVSAETMCCRVRQEGSALSAIHRHLGVLASFSTGCAQATPETNSLDDLVHAADRRMYEQKLERHLHPVAPADDT